MPPRRLALLYAVFGSSTALSAVFGLVDRRSGIIWQQPPKKVLLATWAIALPFTQRKVTGVMFQLQRGCPSVRTACHAL